MFHTQVLNQQLKYLAAICCNVHLVGQL